MCVCDCFDGEKIILAISKYANKQNETKIPLKPYQIRAVSAVDRTLLVFLQSSVRRAPRLDVFDTKKKKNPNINIII